MIALVTNSSGQSACQSLIGSDGLYITQVRERREDNLLLDARAHQINQGVCAMWKTPKIGGSTRRLLSTTVDHSIIELHGR